MGPHIDSGLWHHNLLAVNYALRIGVQPFLSLQNRKSTYMPNIQYANKLSRRQLLIERVYV